MKKTILRLALCCLGTCSSLTVLADSVYQIHPIPHQQQAVGGTTKSPQEKFKSSVETTSTATPKPV